MYFALKSEKFDDVFTKLYGRYLDTGEPFEVMVKTEDFKKWEKGELIQNAFPYLNADMREALISGLSPSGFNEAFSDT